MARYVAKIASKSSVEEAFAYMSDLTNFAEWDPGVTKAVAVPGVELDPPRQVDVTVKGLFGPLELRYKITQYDKPNKVVAEAESKMLRSVDIITVEATDDGSLVVYDAELTLNGPVSILGGLVQPLFDRIGAKAAAGMAKALNGSLV